ncbi:hypothetical protein FXO38_16713 [Capsicum annuum]|nr:hypothetical protein FXO38_16713 [Capsicum annuum]KAF3653420.1 hypothetical protein FXO37_16999 [Capsicum annuum]
MSVTVFKLLNVLLHEFGNNSIYIIDFAEQSAKDDTGSDTKDDDIDIHGKSQQVEGHNDDSDLLEEDYQIEVNFVEEASIEKIFLQNFISPTSIRSATLANDISSPTKKGKKVNTLLPLDEPLDASTPNKVLDDVLGKGKHINVMPSVFLKGPQLKILKALDKIAGHNKELQKTKKEDNHHHNLYLAKVGFYCSLHDNVNICIRKEARNMKLKDKLGSGQKVTNIQDKDSSGPVGMPSLPPVHKNPGVPIESPLTIILSASTVMNNLAEDVVDIPINGFQFIKPAMIDSRVDNHTTLLDVVGCLYEIDDIENCGSKGKTREIKIITDYFEKVKITLWEELGEKFAPSLYNKDIEEEMILNPMDIKELFDSEWSPEIQVSADVSLGNLKDPEDELDITDGGNSSGPGGMTGKAEYRHEKYGFYAPTGSATESFLIESSGGAECIIYRTVMGRIGAIFPFTSRDVVEFHSFQDAFKARVSTFMRQGSHGLQIFLLASISVGPTIRAGLQTGFLAAAAINLSGAYTVDKETQHVGEDGALYWE